MIAPCGRTDCGNGCADCLRCNSQREIIETLARGTARPWFHTGYGQIKASAGEWIASTGERESLYSSAQHLHDADLIVSAVNGIDRAEEIVQLARELVSDDEFWLGSGPFPQRILDYVNEIAMAIEKDSA